MSFIAFLGCDGSGKSAVIAGVTEHLEKQGVTVTCGHWRPQALDQGSEAAAATADDPHGQLPRGTISSIFKLGWLWLNWWLGWFRFLKEKSASGVVLFDRYHADLLVDPKRYRYGGPMWLARLASRMMPQPDLVIFLDTEPAVLLSRKQEVGQEALEQARAKYLSLCQEHSRFQIVDAGQPLETVIEIVFNLIKKTD
jgi:thymidylate kinase